MLKLVKKICLLMLILGFFVGRFEMAHASDEVERVTLTYIVASNEGSDVNLDNDAYRDELIKLFAFSSYNQVDRAALELTRSQRQTAPLPSGYEMTLTYQGVEKGRYLVHALIRKDGVSYVDTVLSVLKPGVVFLGGPRTDKGELIIVLEMGF